MISIYRARVMRCDGSPMLPGDSAEDELAFSNIMDELFLSPFAMTKYRYGMIMQVRLTFFVLNVEKHYIRIRDVGFFQLGPLLRSVPMYTTIKNDLN